MTEAGDQFDVHAWAIQSHVGKRDFHDVLSSAIEQMVLGRGNLRERLSHALFIFCMEADRLDVPREFREQVDKIIAGVNRPLDRDTNIQPWVNAIRRIRLKKADRLVWNLWSLHRSANGRGT